MADAKPGHILEISDALGRDVDKAQQGKIAPPPVEAFLSDATLAEIERATKAKSEPVHAENLRPITRGQADARTTFDGQSLPRAPATRRVIPAPFQRPRIEAGSHGKSWQHVAAEEVTEGDIVPDVGRVTSVYEHVVRKTRAEVLGLVLEPGDFGLESGIERQWTPEDLGSGSLDEQVAVGTVIVLTGMAGVVKALRPGTPVRVFRRPV